MKLILMITTLIGLLVGCMPTRVHDRGFGELRNRDAVAIVPLSER